MRRMREADRSPTSVSKYCVGVALLVQGVERYAFESKLRAFGWVGYGLIVIGSMTLRKDKLRTEN